MRKVMFFILILIIAASCDETPSGINVANNVDIIVEDDQGNDMLDPENLDAYTDGDISIYYLIDGVKEYPFAGNLHYPNFYNIYTDPPFFENYFLRVYAYFDSEKKVEYPVTYIHWDEEGTDIDTLEFHFNYNGNSVTWDKLWLNGVEQSVDLGGHKMITIVK